VGWAWKPSRAAMRLQALLAVAGPLIWRVVSDSDSDATCSIHSTSPACRSAPDSDVPTPSPPSAPIPQITADLITQEMDELEGYIKLCEDRIHMLKDLQDVVDSGFNISLPDSHLRALQAKVPLLSDMQLDAATAPIASADDYVVTKVVITQDDPVSFVRFMPLRSPVGASASSSPASVSMPSALLVAIQADGLVRLFTPSGELAHTFSAGHDHPVTHLAVSPRPDEHMIISSDAGGVVRVHKVRVRQKQAPKGDESAKARRSNAEEKISQFLGSQMNASAVFDKELAMPHGSDGEAPRVTALALASQQGSRYLLAGDAEGTISVFSKNGTFKARMDATTTPGLGVEGFYAQGNNVLFRAGAEWGFVDMEKLEVKHVECRGFDGRITALAIDAQQASRILAADDNGTVWVFGVRGRKECQVEHKFRSDAKHRVVDLASVRGFALGLENSHTGEGMLAWSVSALNMSHGGKRHWQAARAPSSVVWRSKLGALRGWAVQRRGSQGDLIAFLSEDGREIEVAEVLMSVYQPPAEDSFTNFQLPIIAVAVAMVFGYQFMKQKGKQGGGSGKSAGKINWDDVDFAALKSQRDKMKGVGSTGTKPKLSAAASSGSTASASSAASSSRTVPS